MTKQYSDKILTQFAYRIAAEKYYERNFKRIDEVIELTTLLVLLKDVLISNFNYTDTVPDNNNDYECFSALLAFKTYEADPTTGLRNMRQPDFLATSELEVFRIIASGFSPNTANGKILNDAVYLMQNLTLSEVLYTAYEENSDYLKTLLANIKTNIKADIIPINPGINILVNKIRTGYYNHCLSER